MNSGQPNLLFVFSDQHRWCDLGCQGNRDVHSPHLDRFAADGLRFERALSNAPLCVPARGCLLTGRYPLGHGAWSNDLPVNPQVDSVARALGRAGYRTGYFGKWHLGGVPRDQPIVERRRLGFHDWKACNCSHDYLASYYYDADNQRHQIDGYDAAAYTGFAEDFIRRAAESDAPWAAWLSWGPPHDPYFEVPRHWLERYAGRRLPLRPNVPERIVERRPDRMWSRDTVERNLHGYYAHISALDHQFGRLLEALDESGQRKNTIVVYTSDHGDMCGSHGMMDKHYCLYDDILRVPLLVRWPGLTKAGQTVDAPVVHEIDLAATFAEIATGGVPENMQGESLRGVLRGESEPRSHAVASYHGSQFGLFSSRSIRDAQWKYVWNLTDVDELYDLTNDPWELRNLAGEADHQDRLRALRAALARELEDLGDPLFNLFTREQLLGDAKPRGGFTK